MAVAVAVIVFVVDNSVIRRCYIMCNVRGVDDGGFGGDVRDLRGRGIFGLYAFAGVDGGRCC